MSIKNFYSSKPVINYFNKSIEMGVIISSIKSIDCPLEVKRTEYVYVRNETGNGKSIVCGTNVGGVQSDSAYWGEEWDRYIVATCIKKENRTGNERGFIVFDNIDSGLKFIANTIERRGLYIGGKTNYITNVKVNNANDLATVYYKEWVIGDKNYKPTKQEINSFISMYNQATKIFV